jgi:hypothetical protein
MSQSQFPLPGRHFGVSHADPNHYSIIPMNSQGPGFVVDRLDLAQLLASESDVRRGSLTTWLPPANYPARLVQALILARDLGSVELEAEVKEKLRSGTLLLPGGQEVDIASSAKRWAKTVSHLNVR